jgi:hypothetical protein
MHYPGKTLNEEVWYSGNTDCTLMNGNKLRDIKGGILYV